jgi:hypothetical protein
MDGYLVRQGSRVRASSPALASPPGGDQPEGISPPVCANTLLTIQVPLMPEVFADRIGEFQHLPHRAVEFLATVCLDLARTQRIGRGAGAGASTIGPAAILEEGTGFDLAIVANRRLGHKCTDEGRRRWAYCAL